MGFKNNDRCLAKVDEDEPIFVLRAQDATAPMTIRGWIALNERTLTPEHRQDAERVIEQIYSWQDEHADRVKRPD